MCFSNQNVFLLHNSKLPKISVQFDKQHVILFISLQLHLWNIHETSYHLHYSSYSPSLTRSSFYLSSRWQYAASYVIKNQKVQTPLCWRFYGAGNLPTSANFWRQRLRKLHCINDYTFTILSKASYLFISRITWIMWMVSHLHPGAWTVMMNLSFMLQPELMSISNPCCYVSDAIATIIVLTKCGNTCVLSSQPFL